jgi:predicted peptidase
MERFCNHFWARVIVLTIGLWALCGCSGGVRPIAAQGINSALSVAPLLPTLTPRPTLAPTRAPVPAQTALPASVEVTATPEPQPDPTLALGQNAYTTSLHVVDDTGFSRTVEVHYLMYLPGDYGRDPHAQWPLIIFLHGASERGDDPSVITRYSIPAFLTNTLDFPFVVVSPQSPLDNWWSNQADVLNALLDQIQATYVIDPKRISLTGQSMGGYGTWALALKYPARFAALVPVASGWDYTNEYVPYNICDLKNVPIWVFHGAQDESLPPDQITVMVQALQNCGGKVRFTLYPDADHLGSSNRAYADPELYEWLLQQSLR